MYSTYSPHLLSKSRRDKTRIENSLTHITHIHTILDFLFSHLCCTICSIAAYLLPTATHTVYLSIGVKGNLTQCPMSRGKIG